MARKITDIKSQITTDFVTNPHIVSRYELVPGKNFDQQFSSVSIESIIFDVIAFCIYALENIFDLHRKEADAMISEMKPHSSNWYRNMAKNFQYGHPLIVDSDKYDNSGLTDDQITASKIIKYAAVVEVVISNRSIVILKVATEIDTILRPLSIAQKSAFDAYISEVKDAGVVVNVINYLPDRLYLSLEIFYDPLVLDANGISILNGGNPVESAITDYMKELPFNGELVLAHLVDKLQDVEGVQIPVVNSASSSWIDGSTNDYGPVQNINVKKIPESGYFEVVSFDNITYTPYV